MQQGFAVTSTKRGVWFGRWNKKIGVGDFENLPEAISLGVPPGTSDRN
jgi:hypothetical protein